VPELRNPGLVHGFVGIAAHLAEARNASQCRRHTRVILSEAKDLMPTASGDEVLRFAQDDRLAERLSQSAARRFSKKLVCSTALCI
jgi:hypothetical protein